MKNKEITASFGLIKSKRHVSVGQMKETICKRAVTASEPLGSLAIKFFGPKYGVDLQLPKHEVDKPK